MVLSAVAVQFGVATAGQAQEPTAAKMPTRVQFSFGGTAGVLEPLSEGYATVATYALGELAGVYGAGSLGTGADSAKFAIYATKCQIGPKSSKGATTTAAPVTAAPAAAPVAAGTCPGYYGFVFLNDPELGFNSVVPISPDTTNITLGPGGVTATTVLPTGSKAPTLIWKVDDHS